MAFASSATLVSSSRNAFANCASALARDAGRAGPSALAKRSIANWRWSVAEEATLRLEARLPRLTGDVGSSLKEDPTEEVALVELLNRSRSSLSAPGWGVVGPHERDDEERCLKTIVCTAPPDSSEETIRLITCVCRAQVSAAVLDGLRVVWDARAIKLRDDVVPACTACTSRGQQLIRNGNRVSMCRAGRPGSELFLTSPSARTGVRVLSHGPAGTRIRTYASAHQRENICQAGSP